MCEVIQTSVSQPEKLPHLWIIGIFSASLALGAWNVYFAETLYIALYFILAFIPLTNKLSFPTVGIYFIIILWFTARKVLPAATLLFITEALQIIQSSDWKIGLQTSFFDIIFVLAVSWTISFFKNLLSESDIQLQKTQKEAKLATQRIQEELATQLHDTVAKDLSRLAITAENISLKHPELTTDIQPLVSIAHSASQRLRPVILNLKTLNAPVSLEDAIHDCQVMLQTRSLTLSVQSELYLDPQLDAHARQLASLFVQEAATNALKYATACTTVDLFVTTDPGAVTLTMRNHVATEDTPSALTGGFGLANLQQRIAAEGGTVSYAPRDGIWIIVGIIPNHLGDSHD